MRFRAVTIYSFPQASTGCLISVLECEPDERKLAEAVFFSGVWATPEDRGSYDMPGDLPDFSVTDADDGGKVLEMRQGPPSGWSVTYIRETGGKVG